MGQMVQLSWLDTTFQHLLEDVNDVVIQEHVRAFILRMIGEFLMSNTSGSQVRPPDVSPFDGGLITDIPRQLGLPCFGMWSQHLITTNILRHATKTIHAMLDRLCNDQIGLQQPTTYDPPNLDKLHKMDLRGAYTQIPSTQQQQQQHYEFESFRAGGTRAHNDDDEDDEDDDDEDGEEPQLVRCGIGQRRHRQQQQLRVQPPRTRKAPS
ncbi:hypothetical protein Lal_00030049 [Lupinus albus]|nr:hypothetical protein Lal_00030049 [Lupinus albus]